jgi:hypothetical protein
VSALHITGYFTLLIPFSEAPTEWHPTERTGPFCVLSRGAFATEAEATAWATEKLAGQPYELKWVAGEDDAAPEDNEDPDDHNFGNAAW